MTGIVVLSHGSEWTSICFSKNVCFCNGLENAYHGLSILRHESKLSQFQTCQKYYFTYFCITFIKIPVFNNKNWETFPRNDTKQWRKTTCFVRGVLLTRSVRSEGRAYYAHKHENRKRRVRVRTRTFAFPHVAPYGYLSIYSKTEKANFRTN